ncbi:hypothetical protein ACFY2Q_04360 [Micromonospora sp. NPDC000316]|uniref:hypothetical protein n=1 Tax=Micromonospora sp. NPDC000316 TaxID=3364216 RepID=UPI0036AC4579
MTAHPWYGSTPYRRPPATSTARIRNLVRDHLRDTGALSSELVPVAPFTVPDDSYGELTRSARLLLDLVRRTVLALAPDVPGRLAALGMDPGHHPMFLDDEALEEEFAACNVRADVVIGEAGPQLLEFNTSGAAGGIVEAHLWHRAWREIFERQGAFPLRGGDPLDARAQMFQDVCLQHGLPPRVGLVGSLRDLPRAATSRYFDVQLRHLHRHGFAADFFEPEQLSGVTGDRLPFAVGLRQFTTAEWREAGIDAEPVRAAMKAGCLLLPTQSARLLNNKKVLALVSEGQPWMSAAERRAVARYLPWTRLVEDRQVWWQGREVPLLDLAERDRDGFVLKEAVGMKGLQVLLGRDTDAAAWRAALERAVRERDSIIQRYVEPGRTRLEISLSDTETEVRPVAPILSPILVAGRPAGVWARFFVDGSAGVVSRDGFGALENVVLAG